MQTDPSLHFHGPRERLSSIHLVEFPPSPHLPPETVTNNMFVNKRTTVAIEYITVIAQRRFWVGGASEKFSKCGTS